MIEAKIIEIGGPESKTKRALVGAVCTFDYVVDSRIRTGWKKAMVDLVLKTRKNSRIRKEKYRGTYLPFVRLEILEDDGYEID